MTPPRSVFDAVHALAELGRFARHTGLRMQARVSGLTPQGGDARGPAKPVPRRPLDLAFGAGRRLGSAHDSDHGIRL